MTVWDKPQPVDRSFFLENIKGKDGLYCMVTEKIDKELLDAAGGWMASAIAHNASRVSIIYTNVSGLCWTRKD